MRRINRIYECDIKKQFNILSADSPYNCSWNVESEWCFSAELVLFEVKAIAYFAVKGRKRNQRVNAFSLWVIPIIPPFVFNALFSVASRLSSNHTALNEPLVSFVTNWPLRKLSSQGPGRRLNPIYSAYNESRQICLKQTEMVKAWVLCYGPHPIVHAWRLQDIVLTGGKLQWESHHRLWTRGN